MDDTDRLAAIEHLRHIAATDELLLMLGRAENPQSLLIAWQQLERLMKGMFPADLGEMHLSVGTAGLKTRVAQSLTRFTRRPVVDKDVLFISRRRPLLVPDWMNDGIYRGVARLILTRGIATSVIGFMDTSDRTPEFWNRHEQFMESLASLGADFDSDPLLPDVRAHEMEFLMAAYLAFAACNEPARCVHLQSILHLWRECVPLGTYKAESGKWLVLTG